MTTLSCQGDHKKAWGWLKRNQALATEAVIVHFVGAYERAVEAHGFDDVICVAVLQAANNLEASREHTCGPLLVGCRLLDCVCVCWGGCLCRSLC